MTCGSATTRRILKCAHYKRSLREHIPMYMALYELLLKKFFKEKPHLKSICSKPVNELQEACVRSTSPKCITIANEHLLQTLTHEAVIEQLKNWEAEKCSNAMLKSIMNYLHHVETILLFVEASRNSDLTLHLQAGEALSKPFAQPKGVHARNTTWLAQTSVCVELIVKTTQTVTPNMTLKTVMKIYRNIPSE